MESTENWAWYGVRCIYRFPKSDSGPLSQDIFEERITIWRAKSFEDAITKAESEGDDYASTLECERTDFVQAYLISNDLEEGSEVFSLMRDSSLTSADYVTRYFDDGNERQKHTE